MTKLTKIIWFLAVVLLISFFATSYWQNSSSVSVTASTNSVANTPITIGYSNWAGWWIWAVAEEEGLFAKNGVDVKMLWYDSYLESLEALAAGQIDGNSQTLNDTISFAGNAVNGEVVVLVNDNSAGNDKIIVADRIERVEDLKGKDVAVEAGVVDDFLLTLALEKNGMKREDVNIVDIETGAAVEAFAAGQTDAVGAFPPFWLTALKREGARELVSSRDFPGSIPDLLVVSQKLVKEKPKEVGALIDTWFDTLDFIQQNSQRADAIMARRAGVNTEQLQLFKEGTKIFSVADNLKAFSKGNDMAHLNFAAEKITEFLENNLKALDKKPNFSKLFNSKFVDRYALNQQ
ncbi:ABC transporter substrate-binding protein [Myxosarcina sp. GI1]|uniref:ABC transporter substrate-binding protein n=1 Tax=Myxosarcina sp. GI1 TaxID=1541065 RepID=UPI000562532B|nr:ABC transporter substrate-binding protein [Myxosarcina sp. GI1]